MFSIDHLIIGVPNFDLYKKKLCLEAGSLNSAQSFRGQHWTYGNHQKDRTAIHHIHHIRLTIVLYRI